MRQLITGLLAIAALTTAAGCGSEDPENTARQATEEQVAEQSRLARKTRLEERANLRYERARKAKILRARRALQAQERRETATLARQQQQLLASQRQMRQQRTRQPRMMRRQPLPRMTAPPMMAPEGSMGGGANGP